MSIVDKARDIYELVKKDATIELQEKLMEFREEALSLQEENLRLRQRLQELEEQASRRDEVLFEGEMYWRKRSDGNGNGTGKEGPFCQKCYDTGGKLVRLQDARRLVACRDWLCVVCKTGYGPFH
ncbi:MAG: hypothetical protein ABSA12_11890 [Verrucomicrobiia bacterium]|jgi:regulator of replication initiation timing